MRCDEFRTLVAEGAPLDEAARGHLASCAACGEEFAELRALTSVRPAAPEGLRDRVLAALPARRSSARPMLVRAAAVILVGIGIGFAAGYVARPPREVPGPVVKVPSPTPDDVISNVAIAAKRVYGNKVEVTFVPESVKVSKIVVSAEVCNYEQYCPVARELKALSEERPDLVSYKKKKEY